VVAGKNRLFSNERLNKNGSTVSQIVSPKESYRDTTHPRRRANAPFVVGSIVSQVKSCNVLFLLAFSPNRIDFYVDTHHDTVGDTVSTKTPTLRMSVNVSGLFFKHAF
jgi:hypothetical protein